jgi:hypothetical protein
MSVGHFFRQNEGRNAITPQRECSGTKYWEDEISPRKIFNLGENTNFPLLLDFHVPRYKFIKQHVVNLRVLLLLLTVDIELFFITRLVILGGKKAHRPQCLAWNKGGLFARPTVQRESRSMGGWLEERRKGTCISWWDMIRYLNRHLKGRRDGCMHVTYRWVDEGIGPSMEAQVVIFLTCIRKVPG